MTNDDPILTPELLRRAGEALFGAQWSAPLADDLAVAVRVVERWRAGSLDPPPGLAGEVMDLCQHRAGMFRALAAAYVTRAVAVDQAAREISRHVAKLAAAP